MGPELDTRSQEMPTGQPGASDQLADMQVAVTIRDFMSTRLILRLAANDLLD
jgi:hypothetical protein